MSDTVQQVFCYNFKETSKVIIMKMIVSISALVLILCAVLYIKKKTGKNDPDKEIDSNYKNMMKSRYKKG
ncbi:MAG: hypothetical protein GY754_02725 [bacterium]|nr:hypothetical protein [bacterium]